MKERELSDKVTIIQFRRQLPWLPLKSLGLFFPLVRGIRYFSKVSWVDHDGPRNMVYPGLRSYGPVIARVSAQRTGHFRYSLMLQREHFLPASWRNHDKLTSDARGSHSGITASCRWGVLGRPLPGRCLCIHFLKNSLMREVTCLCCRWHTEAQGIRDFQQSSHRTVELVF